MCSLRTIALRSTRSNKCLQRVSVNDIKTTVSRIVFKHDIQKLVVGGVVCPVLGGGASCPPLDALSEGRLFFHCVLRRLFLTKYIFKGYIIIIV